MVNCEESEGLSQSREIGCWIHSPRHLAFTLTRILCIITGMNVLPIMWSSTRSSSAVQTNSSPTSQVVLEAGLLFLHTNIYTCLEFHSILLYSLGLIHALTFEAHPAMTHSSFGGFIFWKDSRAKSNCRIMIVLSSHLNSRKGGLHHRQEDCMLAVDQDK
ncbi:uncharacterized protein LOC116012784 [Ipomoea triloba]|uniref:uncharacterized protein LOC116012784 n=1 Tax=Ipomoea triloba TaxID=35885 RepID=UPI00125DF6C1|nr:uncharacterized protein LOC116012784 [Ipomoea triloba]